MSNLRTIEEYLNKQCLCHENSDLNYALESMPACIKQPPLRLGCDCKHDQEKAIKRALRQFKTFIKTNAKFQVGDRVELALTPEINAHTAPGWMGSKHFLFEGAKATVTEISFRCNEFRYAVCFDDESWIHTFTKEIHMVEANHKHSYWFDEEQIRPANSSPVRHYLTQLWHDFARIGD